MIRSLLVAVATCAGWIVTQHPVLFVATVVAAAVTGWLALEPERVELVSHRYPGGDQ